MKKILLFGSTGFVGKNLCKQLQDKKNYSVIKPSFQDCNLFQPIKVKNLIIDINPDFIINCAYYGGVTSNIKFSYTNLFNNLKIVINILRSSVYSTKLKKIIFFGSGLEYGSSHLPLTENFLIKPKNIYAAIKSITSLLSIGMAKEKALPLILLRPFNLYGPHDKKSVIYYLIDSILSKKKFTLTKGEQVKDYLYIRDFTEIICDTINNYKKFKNFNIYNIGSGKPVKLKTIFNTIFELTHFSRDYKIKEYTDNEYHYQCVNIKKLNNIIKIKHFTPLIDGLKETILWINKEYAKN